MSHSRIDMPLLVLAWLCPSLLCESSLHWIVDRLLPDLYGLECVQGPEQTRDLKGRNDYAIIAASVLNSQTYAG